MGHSRQASASRVKFNVTSMVTWCVFHSLLPHVIASEYFLSIFDLMVYLYKAALGLELGPGPISVCHSVQGRGGSVPGVFCIGGVCIQRGLHWGVTPTRPSSHWILRDTVFLY